jgi:hypothetical protein
MKKILIVLLSVTILASKLSAQYNCFSNLKCTLSWNSNAYNSSQSVVVNTAYGLSNSGLCNLRFDVESIMIKVEATDFGCGIYGTLFSLKSKNSGQLILSSKGPNVQFPNPTVATSGSTLALWELPLSAFQNISGLNVEVSYSSNTVLTNCCFNLSISSSIPPLVLSGPTFFGNPCQTGNNYNTINAAGAGGSGTYTYSFNNVHIFNGHAVGIDMTINTRGDG